jgi:hypothetical protein
MGRRIFEAGSVVARIYEDRSLGTPPELRWRWVTLYVPPRLGVRTDNKVGSMAEAKQQFRRTWEAVRMATSKKTPKETLRSWRVSLLRQRAQYLGDV